MDDEIDTLMVEVRASTQGFASDVAQMRNQFETGLLDGFSKAGSILERSLLAAIRRGSLGFEDLKRTALAALNEIAAQALQMGLDKLLGRGDPGGLGGILGGTLGDILGLPGRATGGLVSPERPYLVGERGPELFVPASAGRVDASPGASQARDVRVSIALPAERGASAPVALRRSSRQVASAIRRALS